MMATIVTCSCKQGRPKQVRGPMQVPGAGPSEQYDVDVLSQ